MMFRISKNSINIIDVLDTLRSKALRHQLWYKVLNNEERTLISMIYKYVRIVKNATLATVIARMIGKLFNALSRSVKRVVIGLKTVRDWIPKAESAGWDISSWFEADVVRWFGSFRLSLVV